MHYILLLAKIIMENMWFWNMMYFDVIAHVHDMLFHAEKNKTYTTINERYLLTMRGGKLWRTNLQNMQPLSLFH